MGWDGNGRDTHLEDCDDLICDRHDPHNRNSKTQETPRISCSGIIALVGEDDNEDSNRYRRHGDREQVQQRVSSLSYERFQHVPT